MTRRAWALLFATALLANAGVTCLYSGIPVDLAGQDRTAWHPALQALFHATWFPLTTAGNTDIRDIVLLIACAFGCLIAAACALRSSPAHSSPPDSSPRSASGRAIPVLFIDTLQSPAGWLALCSLAVLVLAIASALLNRSMTLSWGWLLRFAAGAGWAIILARLVSPARARQAVYGLLIIGAIALLLSLAYRADRGYAYFLWPVGPITITAAMAAVWAVLSGALVLCPILLRDGPTIRSRRAWLPLAFAAIICILAAYVLLETGRRAPLLGLAVAALITGVLAFRQRLSRRLGNSLLALVLLGAVAGAYIYTVRQAASTALEVAGPVKLRFEYWRLSSQLVAERPLLGHGPDSFVVHMTNLISPLRSVSPQVYHGNIDADAHNEWLQAAVELGLPGALLYLALPLGVIVHAVRRLGSPSSRSASPASPALILSLTAGVLTILVLDAASITLRGSTMPMWYWTFLGLLASCASPPQADARLVARSIRSNDGPMQKKSKLHRPGDLAASPRLPAIARPVLLLLLAAVCLGAASLDLRHSLAAADGAVHPDEGRLARLWAEKTISAQDDNALRALSAAAAKRQPDDIALAESLCREMYRRLPGGATSSPAYARALLTAGRKEEAVRVLQDVLSPRFDPFNPVANMLYAQAISEDPVERLRHARRALRSIGIDEGLHDMLAEIVRTPAAAAMIEQELPQVRQLAAAEAGESAKDESVELLRLSALSKELSGNLAEALADQRLVADFYRRLEEQHSPYRRRASVETEAFQTLARLLCLADRANAEEACAAIVAAERYAILGLHHERLAKPKPEDGFLGGEVVLVEFPETHYPLWQLSAMIHVLAGEERQLVVRVCAAMPPAQWSDAAIRQGLIRVYQQVSQDLNSLPPERRPPQHQHIVDMLQRLQSAAPLPAEWGRPPPMP